MLGNTTKVWKKIIMSQKKSTKSVCETSYPWVSEKGDGISMNLSTNYEKQNLHIHTSEVTDTFKCLIPANRQTLGQSKTICPRSFNNGRCAKKEEHRN